MKADCTVKHSTIMKIVEKVMKLVQEQGQQSFVQNQGLKHQFEGPLAHLPGGMRRPRGGLQEG